MRVKMIVLRVLDIYEKYMGKIATIGFVLLKLCLIYAGIITIITRRPIEQILAFGFGSPHDNIIIFSVSIGLILAGQIFVAGIISLAGITVNCVYEKFRKI